MLRCCCSCPVKRASPLSHLALPLASSSTSSSSSPLGPALARLPSSHSHQAQQRRHSSNEQHFRTQHGAVRVNLKAKGAVGVAQSRGERPYQEDAYAVRSLALPQSALRWNVVDDRLGTGWAPATREGFDGEEPKPGEEGGEEGGRRRQVAYFGVFDGHGGDYTSKYLASSLDSLLEASTSPDEIPPVIDEYRALGGYLKRYRGGPLDRFRPESDQYVEHKGMALDEVAVLAFLKADNHVVSSPDKFPKSGSTATVALLHSLDVPYSYPYYASSLVSLTVAHLGDTTALLASSAGGRAHRLTQAHHADSRTESERLRTSGTGIITDSFGESRWGGVVANTRAVGDREFKPVGVIAEPEIIKRVLRGNEWAFLLLCSDGVTDSISDQEIVDLCRGIKDPERAAKKVVSFAEDVGAPRHAHFLNPARASPTRPTPMPPPARTSSRPRLASSPSSRPRHAAPRPPTLSRHTFICRRPHSPARASCRSEDNLTCVVVPLAGWGKLGGLDSTASRREYRLKGGGIGSGRQKRM